MNALLTFVITLMPLAAIFIADAVYAKRARAEGRDPANNSLVHWSKAHPVQAWMVALGVIAVYSTALDALWT